MLIMQNSKIIVSIIIRITRIYIQVRDTHGCNRYLYYRMLLRFNNIIYNTTNRVRRTLNWFQRISKQTDFQSYQFNSIMRGFIRRTRYGYYLYTYYILVQYAYIILFRYNMNELDQSLNNVYNNLLQYIYIIQVKKQHIILIGWPICS